MQDWSAGTAKPGGPSTKLAEGFTFRKLGGRRDLGLSTQVVVTVVTECSPAVRGSSALGLKSPHPCTRNWTIPAWGK